MWISRFLKNSYIILFLILFISCQQNRIPAWQPYDESNEILGNKNHPTKKMRFKLIQSKNLDKNDIWKIISPQIQGFSEKDYQSLKPFIFEQNIPTIQEHINSGNLTYEKLTQWFLYRIAKFENNKNTYLNSIVAINPNATKEARLRDKEKDKNHHPIFGIPIFLKDNINTTGMTTTAGAHIFRNNTPTDAFIVKQIKKQGGIILGKTNLSEWANFLFLGGPNGFSAIGGQTLNPYGRKIFGTGGSSSGSGAATAANFAVAAVGTETSGSILSPSSKNSLVGLKPTTGLLSRIGIVPLSGTLDTPGPMAKTVIDNIILLTAMTGIDNEDEIMKSNPPYTNYLEEYKNGQIKGKRFGVNKKFLDDSLYVATVAKIKQLGGVMVEFSPVKVSTKGFSNLLRADMREDMKSYIQKCLPKDFPYKNIHDIVEYNKADSAIRIPYGQARLKAILTEKTTVGDLEDLRKKIRIEGKKYFETNIKKYNIDIVLSLNNNEAKYAAMANYPCLTLPMGYLKTGEPRGITFITKSFNEIELLKIAYQFEKNLHLRKMPENYK